MATFEITIDDEKIQVLLPDPFSGLDIQEILSALVRVEGRAADIGRLLQLPVVGRAATTFSL